MAERTPEMQRYSEIVAQIKKLEAERDKLKETLIEQFNDAEEEFENISFSSFKQVKFNQPNLFKWVKDNFPDHLEACRGDTIDLSKLEELQALGHINYDEMPEENFTVQEINKIIVSQPKKGVKFKPNES